MRTWALRYRSLRMGAVGAAALTSAAILATGARAVEVFGGAYAHGLGTKQPEKGADIMIGYRTDRIDALKWILRPAVHVTVSANTDVPTDFVAVGVDWPFTLFHGRIIIRPGIGFAYTTGKADVGDSKDQTVSAAERARRAHLAATRIAFGSQDLFEPELAFGYRINERLSAELSYVHLSNGQILHQGKNQGLDDVGLRLNYRFGAH